MATSRFMGRGDVVGPASATDGALCAFDGTTGKLIKVGSGASFTPTFAGVNVGTVNFSGGQVLAGASANLTDLRNGASGQKLRVFGSYTDAANNSYIYLEDAGGSVSRLNTSKAGSGTASDLYLGAGDFSRWIIAAASPHFVPNSNNAADVGSNSSRIRTIYVGTQVNVAGVDGFTGTGAYTNFTISGGIITAAS